MAKCIYATNFPNQIIVVLEKEQQQNCYYTEVELLCGLIDAEISRYEALVKTEDDPRERHDNEGTLACLKSIRKALS